MIQVNGKDIEFGHFPDGTLHLRCPGVYGGTARVTWKYDCEAELSALIFISKKLRDDGVEWMELYMPYIPNARQDRVKASDDVFTLKYFAWVINTIGFDRVTVLDPHSAVSEALFDKLDIVSPKLLIQTAFQVLSSGENTLVAFYPDEGAMKRYSGMLPHIPYCFGVKERDWETGKIKSLSVHGQTEILAESDVLIIDDICSRGGTFTMSAQRLKDLGAKRIFLHVTHCENTIFDGTILTDGLIEKVYTTDSILRRRSDKIVVHML